MDMIDKIDLENGIAALAKINPRIEEVALIVARKRGDIDAEDREGVQYRMSSYRIDFREHADDRAHLNKVAVNVVLSTVWGNRAKTNKFGDPPQDNRDDEDCYGDSSQRFEKYVQFPISYLTSDNWRDDLDREIRENKAWWARYHLQGYIERVENAQEALENATKRLEEHKAELATYSDIPESK